MTKFKLIKNFIVVLICRNKEDPIKNEVATILLNDFSDAQGQQTPKSEMESCRKNYG